MLSTHFSSFFCVDSTARAKQGGRQYKEDVNTAERIFHFPFSFENDSRKNGYWEHISVAGCILFWGYFLAGYDSECDFEYGSECEVPPTRKSIFLFANFLWENKRVCRKDLKLTLLCYELRTWTFCLIAFYELMLNAFVFPFFHFFRTGKEKFEVQQ